ncbi:hypothetical protein [Maricaulis sp.]|uniref:hypothetical protein n=1 Tax=Maricaulis sp. TaxID=1486257 RepID=UPI002618A366|nr:hypothetical protein [Maricaulis sp.]
MDQALAQALLACLGPYFLAGLIFALAFVTLLIKRFDAGAAEAAPVQFRVLIFPGVIALWPVLLLTLIKRMTVGGRA